MITLTETATDLPGKPLPLRAIFILNALMAILPFIFYAVVTTRDIEIAGLPSIYMVYTGIAYCLSFAAMVYFILRRNIVGVRAIVVLNFLIALPAKAYIGVIVAVVSMFLTLNKKVKRYFLV